ncbi:MAG TPA: GDSL family lipase, partial [Balneolaceae bacterium]|nr:GDSL family lipase [Balneolaceae bacterium]
MSPYCKNFLGLLILCLIPVLSSAQSTKWVGTWSTAPQLVEPHNNPPNPG